MASDGTSCWPAARPARPNPPPEAGLNGFLRVEAARASDGRTVLAQQAFRAPFHLGKPYWDGQVLQVQVVNPTAGILAGDRLELAVRVSGGAALMMTTPAAARAFMMRDGAAAECRQTFTVAAGGWLEYAPEPLCPHGDSDYSQVTRIEVAETGEAFWVETLAPGRVGRGELWAWRRLRLGLEVGHGGELVLREQLDSSGSEMARAASFYGMPRGWLATILVLTPRPELGAGIGDRVRALHGAGRWLGVTRLRRGGCIVRAVAQDGQDLRDLLRELRCIMAEAFPRLASDPRKL